MAHNGSVNARIFRAESILRDVRKGCIATLACRRGVAKAYRGESLTMPTLKRNGARLLDLDHQAESTERGALSKL